MRDHPVIERMERYGCMEEQESCGVDVFGDEILEGDEVIEYDGELILADNLKQYLEDLGFEFKTA